MNHLEDIHNWKAGQAFAFVRKQMDEFKEYEEAKETKNALRSEFISTIEMIVSDSTKYHHLTLADSILKLSLTMSHREEIDDDILSMFRATIVDFVFKTLRYLELKMKHLPDVATKITNLRNLIMEEDAQAWQDWAFEIHIAEVQFPNEANEWKLIYMLLITVLPNLLTDLETDEARKKSACLTLDAIRIHWGHVMHCERKVLTRHVDETLYGSINDDSDDSEDNDGSNGDED